MENKIVELSTGGTMPLPTGGPVVVSRTGSTEMYAVDGQYLEVSYLKSGRIIGCLQHTPPNWVRPVNYEWARERKEAN